MWLTQKQFDNAVSEKDLNYMSICYYEDLGFDIGTDPVKSRRNAYQLAKIRYRYFERKIKDTNPYCGLYFLKVDKGEGENYFDKVIKYREFRICHYKEKFSWLPHPNLPWAMHFCIDLDTSAGGFIYLPEDFDLQKIMKIIDDLFNGLIHEDSFKVDTIYEINKMGGYYEQI